MVDGFFETSLALYGKQKGWMRYPLTGLGISFCLGIISGAYTGMPFFVLCLTGLIAVVFAIVFIKQSTKFSILVLFAVFALGAALIRNSQILPKCHIARLFPYKTESVSVIGVIDSDPVYQDKNVSFIIKTERAGIRGFWQRACGKVLVRVFSNDAFFYGERLFLKGKLYRPFSFSKGFDYGDYLKHQSIYLILNIDRDNGMVKQLEKNTGNPVLFFSFKLRHRLREVIAKNLPSFSAGVLSALILGDRQHLSPKLLDILMKLGTIHIIAISGFNVGIVAFIILLILKIIKIPRKPRSFLAISLLIVYCILTGSSAPVVRATIMAVIFLCAYFFKREVDIYNSLSLATFIILAVNPWQLFEVSFQLSFLSVISIVWLSPKINFLFFRKLNKIPYLRFFASTFSVSAAAWVGLLPLIAYYFKTFTTIAVLANMVIVPCSAVITATGFSFVVIGILAPSLAPVFAATNKLLILILFKMHYFLVNIPGAFFRLPEISMVYVLIYYVLLFLIVNFLKIYLKIANIFKMRW